MHLRPASRAFSCSRVALFLLPLVLAAAAGAGAQPADVIGTRAQGMGGAFTAVADDATATWWNPAGLATGAYFSAILEFDRPSENDARPGGFAVGFPALGVSYYRLPVSEIALGSSTGASPAGRQDLGTGDVRLRSLTLSQFGATVGESITRHFVLATTLKLLHGPGETHPTLDAGAMATFGIARIGLTVRNLRETTFGAGDAAIELRRTARAGFAVSTAAQRSTGGVTVAVDADLTRIPTALGDERRVAAGAEAWLPSRLFGFRAGTSASTFGDTRTVGTVGASWAARRNSFVDVRATRGSDATRRGWGFAFRVTF